jgi:hypothetical protein
MGSALPLGTALKESTAATQAACNSLVVCCSGQCHHKQQQQQQVHKALTKVPHFGYQGESAPQETPQVLLLLLLLLLQTA